MTTIPWEQIKSFKIDVEYCIEVRPCHHPVELILKNNQIYKSNYINGRQILHLYEIFGIAVPQHFNYYRDYPLKQIDLK